MSSSNIQSSNKPILSRPSDIKSLDEKEPEIICDTLIFEYQLPNKQLDSIQVELDSFQSKYKFFIELFQLCISCVEDRPNKCKYTDKELTHIDLNRTTFGFSSTSEGWLAFKNSIVHLTEINNKEGFDPSSLSDIDKVFPIAYYLSKGDINMIPYIKPKEKIDYLFDSSVSKKSINPNLEQKEVDILYTDINFCLASLSPNIGKYAHNILFESNRELIKILSPVKKSYSNWLKTIQTNKFNESTQYKLRKTFELFRFYLICSLSNPICCKSFVDAWFESNVNNLSSNDYISEMNEISSTRRLDIAFRYFGYIDSIGDNLFYNSNEINRSKNDLFLRMFGSTDGDDDTWDYVLFIIVKSMLLNLFDDTFEEMFPYMREKKYFSLWRILSLLNIISLTVTMKDKSHLKNCYPFLKINSAIFEYFNVDEPQPIYKGKSMIIRALNVETNKTIPIVIEDYNLWCRVENDKEKKSSVIESTSLMIKGMKGIFECLSGLNEYPDNFNDKIKSYSQYYYDNGYKKYSMLFDKMFGEIFNKN